MNRKHFTLVEVLVVVGIIGVLAGLIIPAVGMARQAGRRTECVSNNGQLAKLLAVTMQANDNYLVSGGGFGTKDDPDSSWPRYLYDKGKLTNLKGFRCSELQTQYSPDLSTGCSNDQLMTALGVIEAKKPEGGKKYSGFDFRGTKRLTFKNGSKKVVVSPSQLVLGGCSAFIKDGLLRPRANMFSSDKTLASFYIVHGDEFNMHFLDGHATSVNLTAALEGKFIPDPNDTDGAVVMASTHIKNFEDEN